MSAEHVPAGTRPCLFCGADHSDLRFMWGATGPENAHYYVCCFRCMSAGPHAPSKVAALARWSAPKTMEVMKHDRS